ncbi:uncharacterized protein CTRU02_201409 [Colletotrichum truncatum]|uniref:Uncharacterized protein n=1 Tax=Colletotrichum truncatum TaxID=5467 RepID=A0ACC3ZHW6_COLTU|nr:uncharacterized protein CTRU02_15467 [Colletotrichum truncatum]KAF6780999.1 hypothetical protein CTRU02_15467 [Colletotrichum truncatum]
MKIPSITLQFFYLSFLCANAVESTNIELDLIFPPNNTAWKGTYPFPLVFAVRNAAVAWNHTLHFSYDLLPINGTPAVVDRGGFFPRQSDGSIPWTSEPPSDTFLVINSTNFLVNITNTAFILRWTFGIWNNCTKETRPSIWSQGVIDGHILFNISEFAPKPDISAAVCPQHLHTMGFEGTEDWNPLEWEHGCPVLADPAPHGDPCGFAMKQEDIREQVEAEMSRRASCSNGTWPNITGPCLSGARSFQAACERYWLLVSLAILSSLLLVLA